MWGVPKRLAEATDSVLLRLVGIVCMGCMVALWLYGCPVVVRCGRVAAFHCVVIVIPLRCDRVAVFHVWRVLGGRRC